MNATNHLTMNTAKHLTVHSDNFDREQLRLRTMNVLTMFCETLLDSVQYNLRLCKGKPFTIFSKTFDCVQRNPLPY